MSLRRAIEFLRLPAIVAVAILTAWQGVGRYEAALTRRVERLPALESLRRSGANVSVSGRDVTVAADVGLSRPAKDAVSEAVRSVTGVRHVAIVTALPLPMSPFRFTARRQGAGIVLNGGVPPGDAHARLTHPSDDGAGPAIVSDDLRPALGAPAGFEDAGALAMRIASLLSSGEVTLVDTALSIQGTTEEFGRYNAVVAALGELPAGMTLSSVDVVPPRAAPFRWLASRQSGTIELSGFVPSEEARHHLRAALDAEPERLSVVDRTQTAGGLDGRIHFEGLSRAAVSVLSRLDSGTVALEDRRLSIVGASPALDVLETLRRELAAMSVGTVDAVSVDLRPIDLVPYRFAVTRNRDGVALGGFVPDDVARTALIGLARQRVPDQPVEDRLHIARAAPDGFAAASRAAVIAVSDLASGSATLIDQTVALDGRTPYAGIQAQWRERFATVLPPRWTASVDLAATPYGRTLDATQCGDLLADRLAREPLRFEPGQADPNDKTKGAIDELAGIIKRCEPAELTVRAEAIAEDAATARLLADKRSASVLERIRTVAGDMMRMRPDGLGLVRDSKEAASSKEQPRERIVLEVRP